MITKEQLQERAQLVRIHEANCAIEHPTETELAFRLAIMKKLAAEYQLRELRAAALVPLNQKSAAAPPRRARHLTGKSKITHYEIPNCSDLLPGVPAPPPNQNQNPVRHHQPLTKGQI